MAIPPKKVNHPYPLIDSDPHFFRVIKYFRASDYATFALATAAGPGAFLLMEYASPTYAGRTAVMSGARTSAMIGLAGGFLIAYQRSSLRFWGWTENAREVDIDMKEMVQKVKNKEPLYGESNMTPYMQGVAARNSRYSQLFFHTFPWFNLANHDQHGVDTSKYYRAAEEELEKERLLKERNA